MKQKSINYFNEILLPFIQERHSNILLEASIMFLGSVGLGIDDELSDFEAVIFLPDEIWKKNGLLQINLDKCLLETNLWRQNGSIICVHPLSWMLDGQGEKILVSGDVPWIEIKIDSPYGLFVIQNQPICYDPQNRLEKLCQMTAPDKMPEIRWKKILLEKISTFVDGIHEIRRCVDRKHFLDACIPFGDVVKALIEIGFISCRQYYPYRKHLSWAFSRLPSPILELGSTFTLLSTTTDWQERLNIMETIYNFYRNHIVSNCLLPELDFNRVDLTEMPLHDNEFDIAKYTLDNPNRNRQAEQEALIKKAVKLGLEPEASRWIDWWKIDEKYLKDNGVRTNGI